MIHIQIPELGTNLGTTSKDAGIQIEGFGMACCSRANYLLGPAGKACCTSNADPGRATDWET
jgi:hypothetical protein